MKYPDFIIIGCSRCGTTSMYNYLIQHPKILDNKRETKEIHFWDKNFWRGLGWYKSLFPKSSSNSNEISGEQTPSYIFHPYVYKGIKKYCPKRTKFIVVLRNPVDRAYSQFQMIKDMAPEEKRDKFVFEKFLNKEEKELKKDLKKIKNNPFYIWHHYQIYSFKAKGRYAEQLKRWWEIFNRKKFFVLTLDELKEKPQITYNRIIKFLNLEPYEIKNFKKYNTLNYPPMKQRTRQHLKEYFKPYNKKLYKLIGKDLKW